eukprot:TRINITY_DN24887_c0_g1_i1.p1 TRINITY_DN24887_c0_g1~~TRINITY_DN24887_c0_g1_i1.p1  ORF type:complete len:313 (+),score=67.36 TRINITY_DN24887_c0_g1_i1:80-940(+)
MIRRHARLRREYIFRKGLEGSEREEYEKKAKLKAALDKGVTVPTELITEARSLKEKIDQEDEGHEDMLKMQDYEYSRAGVSDPAILITTSRDPSSKLSQFAKEVKLLFPTSQRMNRGSMITKDLVEASRRNGFTDIIVLHEHRGVPDGMIVSHLPYGPTAYFGLSNVVMRHDIKGVEKMSEAFPHLVFHNFETKLGERVRDILKFLYPVPKPDTKRTMSFVNRDDKISFRHHNHKMVSGEIELKECGPRFDLNVYQIKLGTLDQNHAENEWVLRPYMNSAKKRRVL